MKEGFMTKDFMTKERKQRNLSRRIRTALLSVFLLITLTVPACGSSGASSDSASYDTAFSPAAAQEAGVYEEIAEADLGAGSEPVEMEENAVSDRKLIKNVNMTVETGDYSGLVSAVQEQVDALGGYTESYESYNENSVGHRSAFLTLRIPADRLEEFIRQVEDISNIVSRQETVEDITLSYVDLESRKKMYEEEQERLLSLLEQAETMEEIIALESRLTEVRYQLESMESQLRTMDNQVSYSTVYLSIEEVEHFTPPAEKGTWERISTGFSENVYRVGNGIKEFFIGLIISLPILFVLAVVIVLILLVIRAVKRSAEKGNAKRMARRAQQPGPFGPQAGPGGGFGANGFGPNGPGMSGPGANGFGPNGPGMNRPVSGMPETGGPAGPGAGGPSNIQNPAPGTPGPAAPRGQADNSPTDKNNR